MLVDVLEHVVALCDGVKHVQSVNSAHHSLFWCRLLLLGRHLLLTLLRRYFLLIFSYGRITAKILDILFWEGVFFLQCDCHSSLKKLAFLGCGNPTSRIAIEFNSFIFKPPPLHFINRPRKLYVSILPYARTVQKSTDYFVFSPC